MQNADQILGVSLFLVIVIVVVATLKNTVLSYRVILGGEESRYRFDKKRLPLALIAVSTLAVLSLIYGLAIAQNLAIAVQFCAAATFFGGIGLITRLCYVLKTGKNDK